VPWQPWGIGFDGTNVWISNIDGIGPQSYVIYEYQTDGTATGTSWDLSGVTGGVGYAGDMALDTDGNLVVIDVGGAAPIVKIDTATGQIISTIVNPTLSWFTAIAINPISGDIYVGGWNEGVIYQVEGFAATNPGTVIATSPFVGIAGMTYHPDGSTGGGGLFVSNNANPDMIFELDPATFAQIASYVAPGTGDGNWGGGMTIDNLGNFWVVCQDGFTIHNVEGHPITDPSEVPGPVDNLAMFNDPVGLDVEVTWDDPTTNLDGSPITDLDGLIVKENGVEVADLEPGTEQFNTTVPMAGDYTYAVHAYDTDGNSGPAQSVTDWVGGAPGGDYLILDTDTSVNPTGEYFHQVFTETGYVGYYATTLDDYPNLENFSTIWVTIGIWA
ncbi:MAG: hypothetical protein GY869_22855, partial [Planctomycetes bacterium]|nr:hypothetical protein [Planctomycetota bacterium]